MTPNESRAIAKDAHIYSFPLVDNYRINCSYFVDPKSPEFKAPWNTISSIARVFTPDDKAISDAELRHALFGARERRFALRRELTLRR